METAMRTHYCGLIDENLIDQTVTLCGWVDRRRDHGGVIFLDMRDREGGVQVVFDPDTEEHFQRADSVRSEYRACALGRRCASLRGGSTACRARGWPTSSRGP